MRQFEQRNTEESKESGGASADAVVPLGAGWSTFISAEYQALDRNGNRFEDGYDADVVRTTLGADYQVRDWLIAGFAGTFSNYDGDYDNGGHFRNYGWGGLAYASFLPYENTFFEVVGGYTRRFLHRKRQAAFFEDDVKISPGESIYGDYDGNEYTAGFLAGYDHPIGNFTIGPRGGLNWIRSEYGSYKEDGDTGLELRFKDDSQTSLQSNLGLQGTAAFSTGLGVVVPQVGVAWIHEFENNRSKTDVAFVDDTRRKNFKFQNDDPNANFYTLSAGVSAVLPYGLQPFANFGTILGNGRFTSYAGTLGLRADW